MTPIPGQLWKWLIAVAVCVVAVWLLVSWRYGLFPFGVSGTATSPSGQIPQPTQEQTIDSLTATGTPEAASTTLAPAFESLTPAAASDNTPVGNPTVDSSVLDSLSAPKQ